MTFQIEFSAWFSNPEGAVMQDRRLEVSSLEEIEQFLGSLWNNSEGIETIASFKILGFPDASGRRSIKVSLDRPYPLKQGVAEIQHMLKTTSLVL